MFLDKSTYDVTMPTRDLAVRDGGQERPVTVVGDLMCLFIVDVVELL